MFLAFQIADIIRVPFGWLLNWLYELTNNYGLALIIFAILIKVILFPMTAKSKKSSMKMSRLTPRIQALQTKYAGDQQKLNEATQALYKEEGVSMGGSCLWSLIPLLILFPLFTVIRQPLTYMLQEGTEVISAILKHFDINAKDAYAQLTAATMIPENVAAVKEAVPGIKEATLNLNFDFLGINLGQNPSWKLWTWGRGDWTWSNIGAFLLPVLSAGSQLVSMIVSQRMNNSVVTNEKGVQDKDAAKQSQAAQSTKIMLYMMPIMSLVIGFGLPGAMSLYWFVQGIVSMVIDVILTKRYRKIYDAEDAIRLQKAIEAEKAEAEKERLRAERRAANPDGITQNTSKKKLQQKQQRDEEAAKAAAAKEYAAKKGIIVEEEEAPGNTAMSGIPSRPYCKGHNYDPNRYQADNTEE